MTNPIVFNDIFHELYNDLEIEANECHLNNNHFYINFEAKRQNDNLNRLHTSQLQQQQQSQVIYNSENKMNSNNDRFFYDMPDYLSVSAASFQLTFFSVLRGYYNPIDVYDLQQLCHLTHQMSIIHLHQQFWQCCLQSGTGQIKQPLWSTTLRYHTDYLTLSCWPEIVTSIMVSQGIIHVVQQKDNIDQDIYVNFVQNYLDRLVEQNKQRQLQFNAIQNRLLPGDYTRETLNDKIEHYIQDQDLLAMRLYFQIRIDLIKCSSMDRLYQWEFLQHKPTNFQLEIAQHLCSLTLNKEQAEQELILFTDGLRYKKVYPSLNKLEASLPVSITSISDSINRERLSKDYIKIIQRAKFDLMEILTKAAQIKKDDCEKKFGTEMAEIWKNQLELPIHERLTTAMSTLIDQRQKNIIECVKAIYTFKENFYVEVPKTDIPPH